MYAADLLHHLRTHHRATLGARACAVLYPSGSLTTEGRARLALAALRAVGVQDLPEYPVEGWLEYGRGLVRAELVSCGQRLYYISAEQQETIENKLLTTHSPDGLLALYAQTREAVRRAERKAAVARYDMLHQRPEERHAALPDFLDLPESERLTAA